MRNRFVFEVVVFTFACLFAGCGTAEHRMNSLAEGTPDHALVNENRRPVSLNTEDTKNKSIWNGQRKNDYDLTISLETASYYQAAKVVLVKVRNGVEVSRSVPDPTDERGHLSFYDSLATVDLMFDQIAELRAKNGTLTVKYNDKYGYPESIKYVEAQPHGSFTFSVLSLTFVDGG